MLTNRCLLWPILALLAILAGCSDSTDPAEQPTAGRSAGSVDPGADSVVLKSLDVVLPGGDRVRIDLLGRDMVLDPDGEHIDLMVSVRNAGRLALPAPLLIWLEEFNPASVAVANADTTDPPQPNMMPVMPWSFGFVYDDEFGEDQVLDPGEISTARLWRFRTDDQEPFGFTMRVEPGPRPQQPAISGRCFWDTDRDGRPDPDESPLFPGVVRVIAPDSSRAMVRVDEHGHYAYELRTAGLHELTFVPGFETFAPLEYTTGNPRHVLITTDDTGALRGYHEAHFGANTRMPPHDGRVIRFTDTPADSLHRIFYMLLGTDITGPAHITFDVGYSGCNPGHDFSLWMTGGFMESSPVQVDVVLVHETDEACEAAWQEEIGFDLGPLRRRFNSAYNDDELLLNIIDFHGERHQILWRFDEWDDDGKPRD